MRKLAKGLQKDKQLKRIRMGFWDGVGSLPFFLGQLGWPYLPPWLTAVPLRRYTASSRHVHGESAGLCPRIVRFRWQTRERSRSATELPARNFWVLILDEVVAHAPPRAADTPIEAQPGLHTYQPRTPKPKCVHTVCGKKGSRLGPDSRLETRRHEDEEMLLMLRE